MQCCPLTCFVSCDELCQCQQMQSLNDTVSLGKENGEFQNGSGYIKLKGCILKISPKHQCAWFPNQLSDLAEISSPPDLKPSKAFCSYFFYVITYIFYLLTTLSNYLLCVFICSCFPVCPKILSALRVLNLPMLLTCCYFSYTARRSARPICVKQLSGLNIHGYFLLVTNYTRFIFLNK